METHLQISKYYSKNEKVKGTNTPPFEYIVQSSILHRDFEKEVKI